MCPRFVFTLCSWITEEIFKCFSLILCKYYSEPNTHSTLLCNQASGSYLESLIISVSVSHFLNFVFFQNQSSKTALERFPENMSEKCLEPRFFRPTILFWKTMGKTQYVHKRNEDDESIKETGIMLNDWTITQSSDFNVPLILVSFVLYKTLTHESNVEG